MPCSKPAIGTTKLKLVEKRKFLLTEERVNELSKAMGEYARLRLMENTYQEKLDELEVIQALRHDCADDLILIAQKNELLKKEVTSLEMREAALKDGFKKLKREREKIRGDYAYWTTKIIYKWLKTIQSLLLQPPLKKVISFMPSKRMEETKSLQSEI